MAVGIASAALTAASALYFGSGSASALGPGETIDIRFPVILFVCLIGALIALRLGIHGIAQPRRKSFSILGIALSAMTIVGASVAMGLSMGSG